MKRFSNLLMALAILSFSLISCEDNTVPKDEIQQNGKITFNLNPESNQLKSVVPEDFSSLSTAIISIKTTDGDTTELKLVRSGSYLFTEEISLPVGDYNLTEFFLQDSLKNTVYACPKEDSPLASYVMDPLPINFSVTADESTPVAVEVLSTIEQTPEEFGFSYFDITFIEQPIESSIVLNYQLNGNPVDNGIFGYHLNVNNAEPCSDRFGQDSMSYVFSGESGLTLYDVPIINQSKPQSLSIWFKTTDSHSYRDYGGLLITIIGTENGGDGSRFSLNIKDGYLRANYGDGWDDSNQDWNDRITSEQKFDDGEWHLATFVSTGDQGMIYLYADGELVGKQEPIRSNHDHIEGLDIKISGDRHQSYFNGCIDEAILYNRALTPQEVKGLYDLD
jgi:hypothetical protein